MLRRGAVRNATQHPCEEIVQAPGVADLLAPHVFGTHANTATSDKEEREIVGAAALRGVRLAKSLFEPARHPRLIPKRMQDAKIGDPFVGPAGLGVPGRVRIPAEDVMVTDVCVERLAGMRVRDRPEATACHQPGVVNAERGKALQSGAVVGTCQRQIQELFGMSSGQDRDPRVRRGTWLQRVSGAYPEARTTRIAPQTSIQGRVIVTAAAHWRGPDSLCRRVVRRPVPIYCESRPVQRRTTPHFVDTFHEVVCRRSIRILRGLRADHGSHGKRGPAGSGYEDRQIARNEKTSRGASPAWQNRFQKHVHRIRGWPRCRAALATPFGGVAKSSQCVAGHQAMAWN